MKTVIACDPGKSGGVAVTWSHEGQLLTQFWKCPATLDELYVFGQSLRTLHGNDDELLVAIEKVHSMPHDGVRNTWTFGGWYHAQQMALLALRQPLVYIQPRTWQEHFDLHGPKSRWASKTEKKNAHKAEAKKLFPSVKITHANADALLIAHYARTLR